MYDPIVRRLSGLVRDILQTNAACFILPDRWAEFETTIKSCISPENRSLTTCYTRLVERNKRLMGVGRISKGKLGQSSREQLIRNLDSLRAPYNIQKISEMCLRMAGSHDVAVEMLLQWLATPYREDQAHIYLSVRLLRKWNRSGYDTGKPILSFLACSRSITGVRKHSLYKVILELIRSKQFSVGRYCQWLLARGALSGRDQLRQVSPYLRLLVQCCKLTELRTTLVTLDYSLSFHFTVFPSLAPTSDICS